MGMKPEEKKKKLRRRKTVCKSLLHNKQIPIVPFWSSTDMNINPSRFLNLVICGSALLLKPKVFNFYDVTDIALKSSDKFKFLLNRGIFPVMERNKFAVESIVLSALAMDNFAKFEGILQLTKEHHEGVCIATCQIFLAHQVFLQNVTVKINAINSPLDRESEKIVSELKNETHELKQKNCALAQTLEDKNKENTQLLEKITALENELRNLRDAHEQLGKKHQETLQNLKKLPVENATNVSKIKRTKDVSDRNKLLGSIDTPKATGNSSFFNKPTICCSQGLNLSHNQHFCRNQNSTEELPSSSQYTPRENLKTDDALVESRKPTFVNENETSNPNNIIHGSAKVVSSHSVQVDKLNGGESMSLRSEPCSSTMAEVLNIYKLLLITIADRLLFEDTVKLNDWANERFAVEANLRSTEIVYQLDQKGVINAFDLDQLHVFFKSIVRFDLVYLIDEFTKGDYPSLRKLIPWNTPKRQNCVSTLNRNQRSEVLMRNSNDHVLKRTGASTKNGNLSNVNYQDDRRKELGSFKRLASSASGNSGVVLGGHAASRQGGDISHVNNPTTSDTPSTSGENNAMKMPTPSSQNPASHGPRKQFNGTSQSQQRNHNMQEKKWLCSHYKRRCYVKFDCCEKFWPCHQCHNKESTCHRKNLKARDTKMVKCSECGKEQQFGEFCISCNIKFADFYCGLCKHVTGTDDFPYHCEKCGICRIHGDRSFHCDTCGVCLDVQLRGNHKCRPDSAHDQCCICLEDAFTGCQILPCSHKVHKHCATQMIQSGITRCPVCRESFSHKLSQRRPTRKFTRKR